MAPNLRVAIQLLLTTFLAFLASASIADVGTPLPPLKISYALSAPGPGVNGTQAQLWGRIRAGFRLGESDPALTRVHEAWFGSHDAYLRRGVERSRPYLYYVVEEVEKRGMPMEIALLPMIESAYNPMALSPMKALGIWQFIPSTGSLYGLKQNAWFDGRRDVVSATQAALDYLQALYGMFGDWELALAAYNCGEGCVAHAQARRKGKAVDYASLKLPAETRQYVPKLVALRNIVLDPHRYGIDLADVANEPYFMRVTMDRPIAARQAARLADMSVDDFLALNPGFRRSVIHTDSYNVLLLPTERLETFQFNLHRQGADTQSLQTYQARKGESASAIANRFGVTVAWLKEHNPIDLHRGNVAQAQALYVPAARSAGKAPLPALANTPKRPLRTYIVRKGDTLSLVAKRYNVEVSDILRLNGPTEPLRPGDTLEIPVSG